MELNQKFKANMMALLKDDYKNYEASLLLPAKRGFRLNKNYSAEADFPFEYEKIEELGNCFRLLGSEKLGNSIFHHLGQIYIQEPSSMLAALCLQVQEGDRVLDLCSAPGGKGSQILEKSGEMCVLNEPIKKRAAVLFSNIERQGFKNAIITAALPSKLEKTYANYFDKILVDAPCSGEGMFRKEPETMSEWNENLPLFNHKRQLEILASADKMLKEGGTLVYSTCTFNTTENEQTVLKFIEQYGYEIVPLPENVRRYVTGGFEIDGNKDLSKTGRCFPQNGFGEGQFIAKLIKKSPNNNQICKKHGKTEHELSREEQKNAKLLVKECMNRENLWFYKQNDAIFVSETEIDLPQNVVLAGVMLAKNEKGRLVIQHQFFKAFGKEFAKKLNLEKSDSRVKDFCYGNEIEADCQDGYVAVLVDGIPLGGGKCVKGRLKNYYPKGLRAKIF